MSRRDVYRAMREPLTPRRAYLRELEEELSRSIFAALQGGWNPWNDDGPPPPSFVRASEIAVERMIASGVVTRYVEGTITLSATPSGTIQPDDPC